jgi:acetyl-CoA decarbonylase/synthase complex subunit delta
MEFEIPLKKWSGRIKEVTIGTGKNSITIGGEDTLPFHRFEGNIPKKPVIAFEVTDVYPSDWIDVVKEPYNEYLKNPVDWAKAAVEKFNADVICLNLRGTHPDRENKSADESAELVKNIISEVDAPLIIQGPGSSEKQDEVLNKCGEAAAGKRCIIASALQDNYKTVTATCQAYGHIIVAESPIDVNIAKQLNILISDMNFPFERIIIDPLTGGLGYGLEYTYSVMERIRLQALSGDAMLQMPFICFIGQEVWRVKEVKVPEYVEPLWGDMKKRGIHWEATTAVTLLLSGAGILVMRHPEAVNIVRKTVDRLMEKP